MAIGTLRAKGAPGLSMIACPCLPPSAGMRAQWSNNVYGTDRLDRQGALKSIAAGITRYHELLQHVSVGEFDASVSCEIDGGIRREIIDEGHKTRRIEAWVAGCRQICWAPFQSPGARIGKPQRDKIAG